MKHTKPPKRDQIRRRPLSVLTFVRTASHLTLGAMIVIVSYILLSGDPSLWVLSAALCGATIAAIWTVTLSIGCLVLIPVGIWRLNRRMDRGYSVLAAEHGQVWDRWMDGPEGCLCAE